MVTPRNFGSVSAAAGASGTWDWDIRREILHIDEHFADLYGLQPEAARAGLPTSIFFQAIHPDDRPRIRIAVAGLLAGAELFAKDFRIVTAAGAVLWMHGRGHCHLSDNDEPLRFTGLLVDITERKRAEEKLRIAQSAGGIGSFEYIDGFATVTVSGEFCRLLGLHPAPVLPVQTINGVLLDDTAPLVPGPGDTRIPESVDAEFRIARSDDGEERWIARRGEIIHEGAGFRLVGVIYDVTAAKRQEAELREWSDRLESRVAEEVAIRQQAEEALRQAQKMEAVGQLTGGIAHDFNNLLMAVMSSLTLLRKRLPADPATDRLLDSAMQGAERGAALTQRMLAFARRQDLTSERVDISALVTGMRELVERTLGPAWTLNLLFDENLPFVLADSNQLEMAVLNLAVNARDAMPQGGTIIVSARLCHDGSARHVRLRPEPYIALSVIDHGEGMDEITLARATEPFFTTKGVGKGTGLGLSMIHGLAEQLGGGFTLHSVLGEGTEATLLLPVASAGSLPVKAQQTPADIVADLPSLKILAVDDDGLILMNTVALLEDLGHEVLEAGSGQEALELIGENPDLNLLITDQAMPKMTGTQLADLVTLEHANLPIILASGYSELPEGCQPRIVRLGKPFTQEMLEQAIIQAMRSAAQPA
ncbi:hybrid sensor histidine kinase/response regulator [Novosphingobium rosa]|uniref:hybrid sensor histidine kinase/response regulator n=1 Tax=Novosphingobium rosa TaxID=76978 RepID=UPI0008299D18|nr:hybrid sensor histidine kinase/response regulator [Novosphingobium rosa]